MGNRDRRGESRDGDLAHARSYFRALEIVDVEFVRMAALRLARAKASEWFPTTAAWHAEAKLVERERMAAQRGALVKRARIGAYLCDDCNDTGFRPLDEENTVEPCPCRELRRLELLGLRPMPALPSKRAS